MSDVDPEQAAALDAMLPLVPLYGWTGRALTEALKDEGADASDATWRFPGGAPEMIETFFALCLDRAVTRVTPEIAGEMRLGKRVRAVVAALLSELGPHKDATRRALSWLILPRQAALSARLTTGLVDSVWHAAGDQSSDFSWYTKRASLAAILLPTLLFWLNDMDSEQEATLAFFDRRLAGLAAFGRAGARARAVCEGMIGPKTRRPGSSGPSSGGPSSGRASA